jgi:hypothetical protein
MNVSGLPGHLVIVFKSAITVNMTYTPLWIVSIFVFAAAQNDMCAPISRLAPQAWRTTAVCAIDNIQTRLNIQAAFRIFNAALTPACCCGANNYFPREADCGGVVLSPPHIIAMQHEESR